MKSVQSAALMLWWVDRIMSLIRLIPVTLGELLLIAIIRVAISPRLAAGTV